jgi:hypothetical protein
LTFDRCEKCKGTWLDRGELSQFNSLDKDLPESGSLISFEKKTDMACPRCDQRGENNSLFQIPYSFEENVSQAELYVGDNLSFADNQDFTVECWAYRNTGNTHNFWSIGTEGTRRVQLQSSLFEVFGGFISRGFTAPSINACKCAKSALESDWRNRLDVIWRFGKIHGLVEIRDLVPKDK